MRTSQRGIDFIKAHESLRLEAYRCPAGALTIGWGHTKNVFPGQKIAFRDAEVLLAYDLSISESDVYRLVKVAINQNQFDALVSFVFNIGANEFAKSTLLKLVNKNPNDPNIQKQFTRWVYGGGKVLPGLLTRREAEAKMYFET